MSKKAASTSKVSYTDLIKQAIIALAERVSAPFVWVVVVLLRSVTRS
jgi:hypothetical protein